MPDPREAVYDEPQRTHRALNPCPWCGRPNDAHTEADPGPAKPPSPGDLAICWGCHRLAIFDDQCVLRRPTPQEQRDAELDPDVQRALEAIRQHGDLGPTLTSAKARER